MANAINKLSDRRIRTLRKPGRHSDGGGLYLIVDKNGAKRWAFLFRKDGRLREMGLGGGLNAVPLATARELAAECRKTIALGGDPIGNRKREREQKRAEERTQKTFGEVSAEFIKSHEAEWTNAKHVAQWRMTIDVYAAVLKPKAVSEITTDDVLAVLRPIWREKPRRPPGCAGASSRSLTPPRPRSFEAATTPPSGKAI